MGKAVFLDRDGVLNKLVLNRATGEYEPPHSAGELELFPFVAGCLKKLQDAGYKLFLVSNQPDYAKGKATLGMLEEVRNAFDLSLRSGGIRFREYYYCYHHPEGKVEGYSGKCVCRKPSPFFLLKAAAEHKIILKDSWMVGDSDIDVQCGKTAGTRTIVVEEPASEKKRGKSSPDFRAKDMEEAVDIILHDHAHSKPPRPG